MGVTSQWPKDGIKRPTGDRASAQTASTGRPRGFDDERSKKRVCSASPLYSVPIRPTCLSMIRWMCADGISSRDRAEKHDVLAGKCQKTCQVTLVRLICIIKQCTSSTPAQKKGRNGIGCTEAREGRHRSPEDEDLCVQNWGPIATVHDFLILLLLN